MQLIFYKKQLFFGSATGKFYVKICGRRGEKMKFYEKLVVLRKKNNMSQEQLADKLGVSRQAVSKWELGSSVPDMEKMMQLCIILNCNLEDLVDDGVSSSKKKNKQDMKIDWKEYYQEILDFITKTLNMFWSMRLIEKVKCLLEMFCIGFLLYFIWVILGNVVSSSFYPILTIFPDVVYRMIVAIVSFIYQIFGIVAGFVILIHIFKIRYLDYFITVEDGDTQTKQVEAPIEEEEKKKDEPIRFLEKKKNTIVIRDPKHSTYGFFGMLARIVIWFMKMLLVLVAVPCICCFIGGAFLSSCFLWYVKDGVFFLGILLAIIGCLLVNYLVLKVMYQFIFGLKIPFQKIFLVFVIGLFLLGFGASISFCTYLTFDKVELNENEYLETTVEEIEMDDDLMLSFQEYDGVSFVEDNARSNVKLEIAHLSYFEVDISKYRQYLYPYEENVLLHSVHIELYNKDGFVDEINALLEHIREKKQIELEGRYQYQVKVYASLENIKKLKSNYQKWNG